MDARNPLDLECLKGFDHDRFGVLARSLQVLLAHGAMDYAIAAVRQFAVQTRLVPATMESQLVDVVGVRLANALEGVGCTTVAAFLHMADWAITRIPNVGEGAVATRDRLRAELGTGRVLEEWDSDGLEFDFLAAEFPREVIQFVERDMSAGMNSSVSQPAGQLNVFEALKLLSNNRNAAAREIETRIVALEDEIDSLKAMLKLLGKKKAKQAKPLAGDMARVATAMLSLLVDKAMKPGEIASEIGSTAIQVGKVAANDARFKRHADGRIALA